MRALPLACLALLLAACGWHLRGAVSYENIPAISVTGGSNTLRYALMHQLEADGLTVSRVAHLNVHILGESWDKRTVAVDTQGRTAALEQNYKLSWRLERDGKPISQTRIINLTSNVNQDPTNATAASDELSLSRESIRRDAIWQLQRQLQSISEHMVLTPSTGATSTDKPPESDPSSGAVNHAHSH